MATSQNCESKSKMGCFSAMHKVFLPTIVFIACGARSSGPTGPGSYPIKDLKALEAQGAYAELVQRMGDVAPSERNDEWKSITERGAGSYLETYELKDGRDGEQLLNASQELMKRYPHLKTSKVFLAKRAEAAIKAFALTYNSGSRSHSSESWIDQVVAFAHTDAVTPKLAERLAKEVVLGRLIPRTAFPLLKLAFERTGKEVCADKALHPVVTESLEDGAWLAELKVLLGTCWSDLKPSVLAKFATPDNEDFVKNTCATVASLPKAASDFKGKCPAP